MSDSVFNLLQGYELSLGGVLSALSELQVSKDAHVLCEFTIGVMNHLTTHGHVCTCVDVFVIEY